MDFNNPNLKHKLITKSDLDWRAQVESTVVALFVVGGESSVDEEFLQVVDEARRLGKPAFFILNGPDLKLDPKILDGFVRVGVANTPEKIEGNAQITAAMSAEAFAKFLADLASSPNNRPSVDGYPGAPTMDDFLRKGAMNMARNSMDKGIEIPLMVIGEYIDELGQLACCLFIDPSQDDSHREFFIEMVQCEFLARNVTRYCTISTAWVSRPSYSGGIPLNIRPSEDPERQSVVMVTACSRTRRILCLADAVTDEQGKTIDFGEFEVIEKSAEDQSVGGDLFKFITPEPPTEMQIQVAREASRRLKEEFPQVEHIYTDSVRTPNVH